ncbi:protein phosphatase CheZ [Chthonobacter albigriseus]|uniref:protein phosphatase CheZ n=1 Tax=Chthonobacter albigriseus TaxID=1683161 RepID=UPI0015EF2296|nr:protein phosphatase CheZ [Chthonobacter albigriseus]
MGVGRKAFRIETILANANGAGSTAGGPQGDRSAEILREIVELKKLVQPTKEVSREIIDDYRHQMAEAMKLKKELDEIQEAILRTKREIATLHVSGFKGAEMSRVTDELDAVVGGTESATDQILAAAESIDDAASTLSARLKGEDNALASDIQEKILMIFEACNFQDLTGQRINKVVNVLRFIEDRVMRMMEIWGGMSTFDTIEADESLTRVGDAALLNGPALPDAAGVASQDDIDALFA